MELLWSRGPPEILYGWGSAEYLKGMRRSRTALVADSALASLEEIVEWLEANKTLVRKLEVSPPPTTEKADELGGVLRGFEPDVIVAVGGGSTIEIAKAAWVLYEHPDWTASQALKKPTFPRLRKRARLIALPTTSGAGAEVSPTMGLLEGEAFREMRSPSLIPDRAILDPGLTVTLPKMVAASSGFDALSHAAEAYLSKIPGPLSDLTALEAFRLLWRFLRRSAEDPEDREARGWTHYAASMAGRAAGDCSLGLAHALASPLSALWQIPHGSAIALCFPEVVRFNRGETKMASLAEGLGLRHSGDGAEEIAVAFETLRRDLGLPKDLREAGISASAFEEKKQKLVREVLRASTFRNNPREAKESEVSELYRKIF